MTYYTFNEGDFELRQRYTIYTTFGNRPYDIVVIEKVVDGIRAEYSQNDEYGPLIGRFHYPQILGVKKYIPKGLTS